DKERPPHPYRGRGGPKVLAQRREFCRDDQHVLLLHELTAGLRRPRAAGACLVADAEGVSRVLVGPYVDPLVERAQLGMTAEGEWRIFQPALDPLGPFLDDGRDRARQHRVGANFIEVAELAGLE